MAAKVITELKGHSGCGVYLMGKRQRLFVRKTGNFQRNADQQILLEKNFPVPQIFSITSTHMDMEYIHGLDMRNFLISHPAELLSTFLINILDKFAADSKLKDYTVAYETFLDRVDFSLLPFTKEDLIEKLPRQLHSSTYHGDLTLENIIYNPQLGFYLIDCSTGLWDSYIFDIAKLRQDLECRWFLRNNPAMLETKITYIQDQLFAKFPIGKSDYLLILMLLRVLQYCKFDDSNWQFLHREIKRLWK